jgi:hypothetical protein
MPILGEEYNNDEGPKKAPIQADIDNRALNYDDVEVDEEAARLASLTYADMRAKVGMCTECKSVIPDSQVEKNVFYNSGQPMSCPFCGGVVGVVPEVMASTRYFQNRLDQMRGIGMTGYIPGVTAE